MDEFASFLIAMMVIVIALFIAFVPTNIYDETLYRDAYYVNAPFGNYGINGDGHFFIATGDINIATTEMYTVKYWSSDGENVLKSETIDASECPVIFDGTFMLEIINHHTEGLLADRVTQQTFKIHLPQIPATYNTTGTIKVP